MFNWFNEEWDTFEAWVSEQMPGWKTHLAAATGVVLSGATMIQEYIGGLPLGQLLDPHTMLIVNVVLFTLVFWLKGISARVEARSE